jgi:hypothetical protein
MARVIEPEVVNSAEPVKRVKQRRPQVRFKIRRLPPAVHRELDERLTTGAYGSFAELSQWLENDHAQYISPSSLAYYNKHHFDPTLRAVKIATAQAAEIVRTTGGDDDEMNLALFRLMQTSIFDLLVQLNRSRQLIAMVPDARERSAARMQALEDKRANGEDSRDPQLAEADGPSVPSPTRTDLAAVTALGKTVATVSRANLDLKKWREHKREKLEAKVAATSARVSEAAREGGLSPAAEEKIRAALLEIKL